MQVFPNMVLIITIGYIAIWTTLFLHEFSHAFFGWLFGVCKSPISIGYLPWVKLPMTPLIDDNKIKELNSYKQILIHSGGLLMNLFLALGISFIVLKYPTIFKSYTRVFILLFTVSNFAELESYITFGAIKPISDVKFILQVTKVKSYIIYIPGVILLCLGMTLLQKYILQESEFGYLIYFMLFYAVACSSRIILTRPTSKI